MLDYSGVEYQVQMGVLLFKKGSKQIEGLHTCLEPYEESINRDEKVAGVLASKGYQHRLELMSGVVLSLDRRSVRTRTCMGEQRVEEDVGEMGSSASLVASILAVIVICERVEDKVLSIRHGNSAGARQMDKGYDGTLEPDSKTFFAGYGRAKGFQNRDEGGQLVRMRLDMVAEDGAQFIV